MKQKILNILPQRVYLELTWWDFKLNQSEQFHKFQKKREINTQEAYSYKPFDDYKAIFVHIPKCAGVSVNKTLFGNLAGGHTTMEEYIHIFEPKKIQQYFKFTIVRNPWDRLVSAYHFLKKGGFGEKDRQWFNVELKHYPDFHSFVKGWLTKDNIWKWNHFRPQYSYMIDRRQKVKLNFIGYLENIDKDFSYITKQLGIHTKLPKSNKSDHLMYIDYYDDETRDIVSEVYSEDINLLGYNFENSNIEALLRDRDKIF